MVGARFDQRGPGSPNQGEEGDRRYDDLAARYGIEILNDWVTELEAKYGVRL